MTITLDTALTTLLRRIALAPNSKVLNQNFSVFQSSFTGNITLEGLKFSHELTQCFLLASKRLSRIEDCPSLLQDLMQRLHHCLLETLQINPVLSTHLQKITKEKGFENSCIDNFLSVIKASSSPVSFSDLASLLGSEWGGMKGNTIHSANMDPIHAAKTFYGLIDRASSLYAGTQSELWEKNKLGMHGWTLVSLMSMAQEGQLVAPDSAKLETLKTQGITLYYPIGYANGDVFFISIIAINYTGPGYRFRLLTSDNTKILAAGEKLDHYCPEVIWDDITSEQLLQNSLWKPLLEAATLTEEEQAKIAEKSDRGSHLAFNSTHLVPWLIKKLGKNPQARHLEVTEECWTVTLENRYKSSSGVIRQGQFGSSPANDNQKDLVLKPTGKEIKRTLYCEHLIKFVNLLALDLIPAEKDRLLYKAESRLLLLTGAYQTLKNDSCTPLLRGNFLRLVEHSFGKITAPIQKLMQLAPSAQQSESAQTLLVSLLDLKHRLANLIQTRDQITLAVPKPLYGSELKVHQLKLNGISHKPIKQTLSDALRLNGGALPLPFYTKWTAGRFPELYLALEKWYDILLEAKFKCEPVELITFAHRNIFSQLPIPSTDKVEDTFPDPLPTDLQVRTLLLLKKIGSLVSSEVFSDTFVPPVFVADISKVYRFAIELYRQMNPGVREMPISWFCLHQYIESRHSFHVPGEIRLTLDALAASFKLISPNGHLKPSEKFEEIPLFYSSWKSLPINYKFHRKSLGPLRLYHTSVDEVLTITELAETVGLRPEETERDNQAKEKIWENSLSGQCVLALKEISQYYNMSILATTEAHRKALAKKNYREYQLFDNMGPEDHFQLEPSSSHESTKYIFNFGGSCTKYIKQVEAGLTPMTHRMVSLNDKVIRETISELPIVRVDEWREQADLLKALPKRTSSIRNTYQLNQAASGPSSLSIDVLLEFFEAQPSLLLNLDYRSYFSAVLKSAHILETACSYEPLLLDRLKTFITFLYNEDRRALNESNLNFERMLWLTSLTRHLCCLGPAGLDRFNLLLGKVLDDLYKFAKGQPAEARLAPHLLASQQFLLKDFKLSLPELAKLHLLVGRSPPTDPNDAIVWLEASEVMQSQAPLIQEALTKGNAQTRRALWSLILTSEEDIRNALDRRPVDLPLATLVKTTAQIEKLQLKQAYLQRWITYWKKKPWRDRPWREAATPKLLQKVEEGLNSHRAVITKEIEPLLITAEDVLLTTQTTLLIQIGGRLITVDWETGRITGAESLLPPGKRLPVHLRKHPDLAQLGELLRRPLITSPQSSIVHFQDIPELKLDLDIGGAWLKYNGDDFRLVSPSNLHSIELPDLFTEGFSLWLNVANNPRLYGLLAAHALDGTPHPSFAIDPNGAIRPLKGNTNLRLAKEGYYPEAQLFHRWGLSQKHILVWLDEHNNVAEMHLPLNNSEGRFTRISRSQNNQWNVEGLDVKLEETHESVTAFAGYPVYLVAKNTEGQRILLLPGATPYEIKKRHEKDKHEVDWNGILTQGPKEVIHQFRIMPSGKVEGLTVADNLLLMLWTVHMGHYVVTADLAKRWLTPPGRPYTKVEEQILTTWIRTDYGDPPMLTEAHPSALSLRLFVIVRMARHLRDFPSNEGKKMSKLSKAILGEDSYQLSSDLNDHFLGRGTLGHQIRGTDFEELISMYDHEAALRLVRGDSRKDNTALARRLYLRKNHKRNDQDVGATFVKCDIAGREIYDHSEPKWSKYTFKQLVDAYPTMAQTNQIPIDQINRSLVPADLGQAFDKSYTLIKKGPVGENEDLEYKAILQAFADLRGEKASDICMHYLWSCLSYYHDDIFEKNLLLWLLLEQAHLAKLAGKDLPELPAIQRRFGLALQGSKEITKEFFTTLVSFSGVDAGTLLFNYRKEWFAKRSMRYLDQDTVPIKPPDSFLESLKTSWPLQLTSEIDRWSRLSSPVKPNLKSELGARMVQWTYSVPSEWCKTPLPVLKTKIGDRLNFLSKEQAKHKKNLQNLANALPEEDQDKKLLEFARQIHYSEPLSIDECIILALRGDAKLQQATILYLEAALEFAHLQRSLKELEICLANPQDSGKSEQFLENLTTPPHYLPSQESLPLMITEYYSDCRLRTKPDQAGLIELMTCESTKIGKIIQAVMGSGKSKMLGPAWLEMMLNQGRIPFLCVPSSMFRTTLSDLQNMMWNRFRTHVRAFTFEREKCSSNTLHALAESMHIARQEPTVFVAAIRDLHAFQLMLKERHQVIEDMRTRLQRYTIIWANSCLKGDGQKKFNAAISQDRWSRARLLVPAQSKQEYNKWFESHTKLEEELKPLIEESNLLQSLLNLYQHEQAQLVDEVATSYDPRNLLSFPIGWQVMANPQAAVISCKIYFDWLPPYFDELNLLNNMQSLSKEALRNNLYLKLAATAWKEYSELLPGLPPLDIFTAYMLSDPKKGKAMQAFVYELNNSQSIMTKQLAQELAFLKYCLTVGLEGALTSTGYVNYGRSKQDPHLYLAIPYQCANVPKENTLFRRPWKKVLMTCQHYSQVWNDANQTAELIGFLQGIDPSSKDQKILDAATLIWGRRFGDVDLSNRDEMKQLTIVLDEARRLPSKAKAARLLIMTYLQSCVFPTQLKLDPSQLTSTPQDIPMMAVKSDAMGGTFGFETTWNPKLVRIPDYSSDESVLKVLAEPRNQTCHIIPKGGAESFFKQLKNGALDGYLALIDAGAFFKGLSNTTVAKRFLESLQGFDCVVFYDEEQSRGSCLAVMTKFGKTLLEASDKEGVRRALTQLKLSNPFTYYDQANRINADLELKDGGSLITFSEAVIQDDVLQSAMRARRLLIGGHYVAYAIPEEMEGNWTGDKVIATSKEQQKLVEGKANFHAVCEQLRGEARARIDRAMRSTSDFESRHEIHKNSNSFLMEEQDNDLVKTFGSLQGMMLASEALKLLSDQLVKRIEMVLPDEMENVHKSLNSILQWHKKRGTVLPEWVREGDTQEDAVQEVDLSKDQDRMRLMEEEYERMLGTRNPKKEIAWSRFDLKSIKPSPFGSIPDCNGMPALFKLKDALQERGFNVPFTSNLLISANILTTFLGETNCLLTENQKPVHRILFVRSEQGPRLVLLSEGDAKSLKEHLNNMPTQQGKGVYIVEPAGAINQRGWRGEEIFNLWKDGTKTARCLLLQALVFQGSALLLERLPVNEVKDAFDLWTKLDSNRITSIRVLFEASINLRPDDMLQYRRSQKLRALFH